MQKSNEREVTINPETDVEDFELMKNGLIDAINHLKNGAKVIIDTEKEEDNFIYCSTEIEYEDHGQGQYYGGVGFVNPESIINFIVHCAGFTKIGSLGFGVCDKSETEVEIELILEPNKKH